MAIVLKTFPNCNVEACDDGIIQDFFSRFFVKEKNVLFLNEAKKLIKRHLGNKVIFNQTYILIYGRIIEIEEDTEYELQATSGYVVKKIIFNINLRTKKNEIKTLTNELLNEGNLSWEDIKNEEWNYDIELFTYQLQNNTIYNIKENQKYWEDLKPQQKINNELKNNFNNIDKTMTKKMIANNTLHTEWDKISNKLEKKYL
ncbi:hypothetical protein SKUN_001510 [Spiroplasma kunkelii CR2-3x]|uniref:Uncharacterized protein n=1 Tax=Spiroplasma kunkelii CR2-3x TaxID=273035 RepID=A0A0K2JIW2_SPIKU|nr:hypothetical protein [Spiroplasma kunkelii]ALA98368.1 hypothetical protein SKUN_001510 [Spiroplasma kunkelii CR2-3x]